MIYQKIESKQVIEYDDFNLIKEIEDIIKIIKPNLCASFTDHSECPRTRFILQNDLNDFLDILLPLFSNFSHLTQKELYPAQKVLKVIIKQEERKKEEERREKLQTPKNEFEKQMNEFENQMKLMFEQMKLCLKNEMEEKNKEFQKKLDEKEEEIQRLTEQLKILQKQAPTTTNENIEKK